MPRWVRNNPAYPRASNVDTRLETDSLSIFADKTREAYDLRFRAIVAQLKALPEEDRKAILAEARSVGHPTWAQLGRITTDGNGQTEAGQTAERLIAGAIVSVATEMLGESIR